mgnify:CR=1 FL=1
MTSGIRRSRVPALLLAALAALLVFAAAASAETRTGESSTVIREGFPAGEFTLVKAAASYESSSGSAVFNITTATGPQPESEGTILAGLTTSSSCTTPRTAQAVIEQLVFSPPPLFVIQDNVSQPAPVAIVGSLSAPTMLPATRTVNGTTTVLSVTSGNIANAGFNCAIVAASGNEEVEEEELPGEEAGATFMSFPISAPPAPPAAVVTAPPAPVVAPPAPPVLSIGKLKPVSLKTGKWRSVRVKVTNTGATGTGPGSLRVRTTKGVMVKPERQQLPVLAPGASWTITVRVQLTAKAKPKSNLKLTAAASGVTGTRTLVLKSKG